MTYCVGIAVENGLVFCSDSRTNAGPDMLFTHSKMYICTPSPDRLFVMLTAGNLATTQAIVARLKQELEDPNLTNLGNCGKMIDAARYISNISREEQLSAQSSTAAANIDTSVSLILGGQIAGAPPALYMFYSAGNFITDSDNTPFLQIGESKYGKPILDRILNRKTSLEDAARCAIVSMDSTIKSNATVGPPIEVLVYKKDSFLADHYVSMEEDDQYLYDIRQSWNEALNLAFAELPKFEWEKRGYHGNVLPMAQETNR